MLRSKKHISYIKHAFMLMVIPLLVVSTGYAVFSQQLTVTGKGNKPAYSFTNNMSMSYSIAYGTSGQRTVYNITMTVKYNGSGTIESWSTRVDLPTDFSSRTCQATVICSNVGNRLTISNGAGNGTINPNGTVTFTFSFQTNTGQGYELQEIVVAGILVRVYQTMSGLTFTATPGTRTKSGNRYSWPYTIQVTNNSGQAISAWKIESTNWTSANQITGVSSTVNYVATSTLLTVTSKTGLANSASITFNATMSTTNQNWVFAGTIQGAL